MGMEALQQSIIQRPNLVMGGLDAADNEADQRRLFAMQRQGQLVQGILQALGLWTEQQRFGANMDETQRQFDANTYVTPPEEGMPLPQTFRGAENTRQDEQQGWQRNVQGDPGFQANQRDIQSAQLASLIGGNEGQGLQNEFSRRTMDPRIAQERSQAEGAAQGVYQAGARFRNDQENWPLERQSAELGLKAGQRSYDWAGQDRPGQVEDAQIQRDAAKVQADWLKRFQSAPDDAARDQIAGEDPDMWLRMNDLDKRIAATAGSQAVDPTAAKDFVLKELRERSMAAQRAYDTGKDEFMNMLEEGDREAAGQRLSIYRRAMERVAAKDFVANAGETPEMMLGRALREIMGGVDVVAPDVAAPASQAVGAPAEDFSTGIR